jgi:hypothetical protein
MVAKPVEKAVLQPSQKDTLMKTNFRPLCRTLLIGLIAVTTGARAWDGAVTGKIDAIESTAANGNADVRVYFVGRPNLCTGPNVPTMAFINTMDPNYKSMHATLLMAYALNKTVTLYSTIAITPPVGYCQIGFISVSG